MTMPQRKTVMFPLIVETVPDNRVVAMTIPSIPDVQRALDETFSNNLKHEARLKDIIKHAGDAIRKEVDNHIGEVITEYLPHVLNDTEFNVLSQSYIVLEEFMRSGKWPNGYNPPPWTRRDVTAAIMRDHGDEMQKKTIEELEHQIKNLKDLISYR